MDRKTENSILYMHTVEKEDIVCDFILKDGFVTGVRSSDDYHFHSFFEIHYVISGQMDIVVDDRDMHMCSGDVCILPPKLVHYIFEDEGSYRVGFRFSFTPAKSGMQERYLKRFQDTFGDLKSALIVRDCALFQQCLRASAQALGENAPAYIIDELLFLAIDRLSYSVLDGRFADKEPFVTYSDALLSECVEEYFNCHYRSVPKIGELANSLGMSIRQTQRVIQRLFGLTFSKLLVQKRLTVARFLLRTTSLSVEEITHRAGFYDKPYFCRRFKAYFGTTPTQYRRNVQKENFPLEDDFSVPACRDNRSE